MRYLKFTFILSMFVLLFSNQSKSMDNRCYEFIEGLKNLEYDKFSSNTEQFSFQDFGFDLAVDPIKGVGFDTDKDAHKLRRDKENYPIIKTIGYNKIALGTDYPFPLGETKPGELIKALNVADDVKQRMYAGTALEWLGIDEKKYF